MAFKVRNSNLFLLPGNPHMLHLGTIEEGFREFIVMACLRGPKKGNIYIEEVVLNSVDWSDDVFAHSKFISDDALAEDLARFAEMSGLTDMKKVFERIHVMGKSQWLVG